MMVYSGHLIGGAALRWLGIAWLYPSQLTVNVRDLTEDNQDPIRVLDIEESSTQLNVSIVLHGST